MPPTRLPALVHAATLILVRHHIGELQTYLLRRSPASGFMPGFFVFPGGLVDSNDGDESFWMQHVDLTPRTIGTRLGRGLGPADVLPFAIAAVRETFEEAGILYAERAGSESADAQPMDERRRLKKLPKGWLRTLVEAEGWMLRLSGLSPWSHWITPVGMPRRFDTRFFVAALPDGQSGRPDMREIIEGLWLSPRQALTDNLTGRTPLSPPTLVTLHELLKYPSLEALRKSLEGRVWGEPIFPRLVGLGKGGGSIILEPWDPMHGREDVRIDAGELPGSLLPAGAPFSRLWNDGGVWKPVA